VEGIQSGANPPKKLLGSGFSTPYAPFCLICTISSELTCTFIFTHLSELVLIFAGFQWTGSTPAGFQEVFRVVCPFQEVFRVVCPFQEVFCVVYHTEQYISKHAVNVYMSRTTNVCMFVGGGHATQTMYKSTHRGHIWVTNWELVHVCRWRRCSTNNV